LTLNAAAVHNISGTVSITLKGNTSERTITKSSANGALFVVNRADLTLILDANISLTGKAANNAAAVTVTNGKLEMRTGAKILGNTNTNASGGGGVYNAGIFQMSGDAAISGNLADDKGAGIYVAGAASTPGMFTMSGAAQVNANNLVCLDLTKTVDPTIGVSGNLSSSPAAKIEFDGTAASGTTQVLSGTSTDISSNAGKFTIEGHYVDSAGKYQ
jgi:hypothetical protein